MIKRFKDKYKENPNTGCWEWTASTFGKNGYGQFSIKEEKITVAHRASWFMHYGKIPHDMCILHKCDVRRCVNPKHLFIGTKKDNAIDAIKKGRFPNNVWSRDEKNISAKLTNLQVKKIRLDSRSNKKLSEIYGVCVKTIFNLKTKRTYRDVK